MLHPYEKPLAVALVGGFQRFLNDLGRQTQARVAQFFDPVSRGTSMWMSMRSSSKPERRVWYSELMPGEQV